MTSVAYDLASTPQFWKSYDKLSRPHRTATADAIEKVQDGHLLPRTVFEGAVRRLGDGHRCGGVARARG